MWKLVWELPLRGEYNNKKKVLILVCVEVSVGVIRLNLCRLTARNVLILVCVEVSVGDSSLITKFKFIISLNPCLCGS